MFDIHYPAPFNTTLLLLKWPALDFGLEDINLSCLNVDTSFYSSLLLVTIMPMALIALFFLLNLLWHLWLRASKESQDFSFASRQSMGRRESFMVDSIRASTDIGTSPRRSVTLNPARSSVSFNASARGGDMEEAKGTKDREEGWEGGSQSSIRSIRPLQKKRSSVRSISLRRHASELKRSAKKAADDHLTAVTLLILYVTLPLATMWAFRSYQRTENQNPKSAMNYLPYFASSLAS